jgi:pimeloyl-ACP methyl ester carboxylesterase
VHSWGGYVLWEYLAAHPERVASLVLVAASAPDEHANHVATKRLVDRLARLRAAGYLGSTATLDGTARLLALAPAYFHDPLARIPEALLASESSLDVRAAVLAALAKEPRRDHAAAAAAFRGPALVIVGESDPLGVELAEANVACLARGRLALLESAGHFPWLEPVALERFLALVRSELTSRR